MPTEAGLPGWFPEDFSTDPELLAAFEDDTEWHASGRKRGGGKDLAASAGAIGLAGDADGDPDAVAMATAHRLGDVLHHLARASQRMQAAREATSADQRANHSGHLAKHLKHALKAGHGLTGSIREHYPAEAEELEKVKDAVGLAKAVSEDAKAATTAHLLETTLHELAHASRHAQAMKQDTPDEEWQFNADHAEKHLAGAAEHADKLRQHMADNYPDEAKWLAGLVESAVLGGSGGGGDSSPQHARYAAKGGGETITAQMASGETIARQALDLAAWEQEARGKAGQWISGEAAYHGTSAELRPGDLIEPGHEANFDVSKPGHVYFTDESRYGSAVNYAKRAARTRGGQPHVYRVEPTGDVERDPDFAVSGGSFRTRQPLRVVGEDEFWKTDPRFAKSLPLRGALRGLPWLQGRLRVAAAEAAPRRDVEPRAPALRAHLVDLLRPWAHAV